MDQPTQELHLCSAYTRRVPPIASLAVPVALGIGRMHKWRARRWLPGRRRCSHARLSHKPNRLYEFDNGRLC